jgi:NitT/TauT family transport system permease protein
MAPRRWQADALVAGGLVAALYGLMHLSSFAPDAYTSTAVDLGVRHLPYFAVRSVLRMLAAYGLSLLFTLTYGYVAAYNRRAERIMLPVLDILQSIPVLSFMPSVVLALVALFPRAPHVGQELASIVLIFTGQAWNMTFSYYYSLKSIPAELREAAAIQQMNGWQRLRTLELPSAAVGLVWNSMMSWAGGWFFLMACEMLTLGNSQFTLPGLGSYMQAAANAGDAKAMTFGLSTLIFVIVLLDQLVWRPIVAWADKFKVELVNSGTPPRSVVLTVLRRSQMIEWLSLHIFMPLDEKLDGLVNAWLGRPKDESPGPVRTTFSYVLTAAAGLAVLLGLWKGITLLAQLPLSVVGDLALAAGASFLRVTAAIVIGLAWTIPVGVAIGSNPRLSAYLQPVTQIAASVPATALFPMVLLVLLPLPFGMNWAAVALLLLGTQWYLLFNVIAGASGIPADLKETGAVFQLTRWEKWRTLILPAIFPQLVTGLVTASGGAWNATIVAEYQPFHGAIHKTIGLGATIADATSAGNFPLLLAATIVLAALVVSINRLVWRRLYRLAESRYSLL